MPADCCVRLVFVNQASDEEGDEKTDHTYQAAHEDLTFLFYVRPGAREGQGCQFRYPESLLGRGAGPWVIFRQPS